MWWCLKKNEESTTVSGIHHPKTMNVCAKFHGNPFSRFWDIKGWATVLGRPKHCKTNNCSDPLTSHNFILMDGAECHHNTEHKPRCHEVHLRKIYWLSLRECSGRTVCDRATRCWPLSNYWIAQCSQSESCLLSDVKVSDLMCHLVSKVSSLVGGKKPCWNDDLNTSHEGARYVQRSVLFW